MDSRFKKIKQKLTAFLSVFREPDDDSYEFMPGVQGVLNAPLKGLGWAIPFILFLFLVTIILWLWFSETDIISQAQATLLPSSRIKLIQTKEVNVVDAIYVQEGSLVQTGTVLVKFKGKNIAITIDSLEKQIKNLKVRQIGWISFSKYLENGSTGYFSAEIRRNHFSFQDIDVIHENNILNSKIKSFQAENDSFDNQAKGLKNVIKKVNLEIEKLDSSLTYQKKRFEQSRQLFEKQIISEDEYDDTEQTLREISNNLKITQQELIQTEIEYDGVIKEKVNKAHEKKLEAIHQIGDLKERIAQLENDLLLQKVEESGKLLLSPINGKVTELTIHTIGGVVQSGEVLMKIVPEFSPLEAEAKVMNKDIGFVSIDQKVNVKIDSFSFTKYGYIEGTVIKISETSEVDEQLGPIFPVVVELEKNSIKVDGRKVSLKPGMTAIVDIKIGTRKLAEYIISPLLRYQDEAMRER